MFRRPVYVNQSAVKLTNCFQRQTLDFNYGTPWVYNQDIKELKIDLNIPPFLGGCSQLPPEKIDNGTKIASLCMNVERVIVSMKTENILKWNCTFIYGMYHKQNVVYLCSAA